jgi:hypothetical protein
MPILFITVVALGLLLLVFALKLREARRAEFIRRYSFPKGLIEKLQKRRPGLPAKDGQLVARALRQFFLAHHAAKRQFVSMPSQVTDDLWHEFILYTRNYEDFCQRAFGRFMHHTPAVVLGKERQGNTGLRRTWWFCCKEENISPMKPTRLPLLFAIDAKLGIGDGFHYVPDCKALREGGDGSSYCGGDFGSGSSDGGSAGFSDVNGEGGGGNHGDGSGSSDGGGGDGGGCGGGGD